MKFQHLWIEGNSCSGKTNRLAEITNEIIEKTPFPQKPLILCFNQATKKIFANVLLAKNVNSYQQKIRTPAGLMIEDVFLFYPLICQKLQIKFTLPIRLLSETEQELATQLWHDDLTPELLTIFGGEYNCVRRILDFIQLAGTGTIGLEEITQRLYSSQIISDATVAQTIAQLIVKWREWCLDKGLLSYGLIYELYWRYLLTSIEYQSYLGKNYTGIFADDVDNFPAVMVNLAQVFLTNDKIAVFTYNPQGKVRLGFNADPDYWQTKIKSICRYENLTKLPVKSLVNTSYQPIINLIKYNNFKSNKFDDLASIQTNSRGDLLTTTIDFIAQSIASGKIKANEIAIIAAGLDEVARYSLSSSLDSHNIKSKFVHEQRPLISSPLVRSILTLLCFLYSDLGRLIALDMVVQMLVILSAHKIDLVRAGLLVDYCYYPDLKSPMLSEVEKFSRWDRLNVPSLEAYNQIRDWIITQKTAIQTEKKSFLVVVDEIIASFFGDCSLLNHTQISHLRGFTETVAHFWQVQQKLGNHNIQDILTQLINLLIKGTITANPLPVVDRLFASDNSTENNLTIIPESDCVTIANIYQYRTNHLQHRWHFWLDVGSNFWSQSSHLFASELFLQEWETNTSIVEKQTELDNQLLPRIVYDLLARVNNKVFLCHSNLTTNGSEQTGKLLPLLSLISNVD